MRLNRFRALKSAKQWIKESYQGIDKKYGRIDTKYGSNDTGEGSIGFSMKPLLTGQSQLCQGETVVKAMYA